MEVSVEHLGGVQFEIKARQHTIAGDLPPENGGYVEGLTPPESPGAHLWRTTKA